MSRISNYFVAVALGLASVSSIASAQDATLIKPGAVVSDPTGLDVGVITAVKGNVVTIKTDRNEANLGTNSITPFQGKLLISMTQAQLNAAVDEQNAKAAASLAVGAPVKGKAGATLGTIDAIDDQFVTLKLESGKTVKIARTGIAAAPDGAVVGVTAAELEAQLGSTN